MPDSKEDNAKRATRAELALNHYAVVRNLDTDEDPADVLVDLLTDLHHFAKESNLDISTALATAAQHYAEEKGE